MGNSQSSDSSSNSSDDKSWEYTPSDGGNGSTSEAIVEGVIQGVKEFFEDPITETATAADDFQSASDWADIFSGK